LLAVDAVEGGSADAARVERCMEDLPDDQRRIIQLSFFSHLPHGEIARRLGLPLGTVKSRVRLAIAKLRKALRDEA
jgi:RNA polymerase sigma-70 factor (ECF subfamily)